MGASATGLQFEPELAVFRLAPGLDVRTAVSIVTAAIAAARADGATRLLVDVRAIEGGASPGLGQRYAFATDWARAAQGAMSIAMLAPAAMVDPGRFGVLVAHGAGLDCDVFPDEPAARAWLARRPAPGADRP